MLLLPGVSICFQLHNSMLPLHYKGLLIRAVNGKLNTPMILNVLHVAFQYNQ
jgi:hypothetical protein